MDIQPQTTKPISDDQELAKVLAGITQETNKNLSFGDDSTTSTQKPVPPVSSAPVFDQTPAIPATPVVGYNPPGNTDMPAIPPVLPQPTNISLPTSSNTDLEGIRKDALTELRPLVDKLDLEPEEKFDIYLLLLRSTDDKTLIAPAHTAAKEIADESKRAQALLDIIKEIDYLSTNGQ